MDTLFRLFSLASRPAMRCVWNWAAACRGAAFGRTFAAVFVVWAASSAVAAAQAFTSLVNFNGTDGSGPQYTSLVQGRDGNLWGTTTYGGTYNNNPCLHSGCGTIFKMSPSGAMRSVYSFTGATGSHPVAGLTLGTDGNFYGVTSDGGAFGNSGTVFKLTTAGVITLLATFNGNNGANPFGALTHGTDGSFYGTTSGGGPSNVGTVFKITPGGKLTTLYNFDVQHGSNPYGQLVQGTDGNFYGTTDLGGPNNLGTVFKITPTGTLTVLHSFTGPDGSQAVAGLVQGQDGNFYGTTNSGGPFTYGTVFQITPAGVLTTLHNFGDGGAGGSPIAPLVLGTDGNFYGSTNFGTIFQITAAGAFTNLFGFSGTEGKYPEGGVVQATNGTFYGVTYQGGTHNDGTVFSLNTGLGAFVKTLPTSGKVGAKIGILGTGLTGATDVTFNGTPATFSALSDSFITATVPAGATSGPVQVTTPGGALASNVNFQVAP